MALGHVTGEATIARLRNFVLFAALGALGTLAQYAVLVVLASGMGVNPVAASTAGFLVGGVVNYVLGRNIAFRSDRPHREAAPRFFLVAAFGLVLNALLMAGFTAGLGLPYLPAQLMTTGLLVVWHYTGNLLWTFRPARS